MMAHVARKRFGQNFLIDGGVIADIITAIAPATADNLVEIGPGRVLKGLIRKIDPALVVHNIQSSEDIATLPF